MGNRRNLADYVSSTAASAAATAATPRAVTTDLAVSVPVERVALNPLNDAARHDNLEKLTSMKTLGQLAPCVVVTTDAFHRIYSPTDPDPVIAGYAASVAGHDFVVSDGSRRLTAVTRWELGQVKITVDDRLAATRAEFLLATTAANLDRDDPNLMQYARQLDDLARELNDANGRGGASRVAERLGKSRPWVTGMRSLLALVEELADLARVGELPFRVARELANLPADQQVREWRKREGKAGTHRGEAAAALLARLAESDQTPPPARDSTAGAGSRRRWAITDRSTPQQVGEILVERFGPEELTALIEVLSERTRP